MVRGSVGVFIRSPRDHSSWRETGHKELLHSHAIGWKKERLHKSWKSLNKSWVMPVEPFKFGMRLISIPFWQQ